jgi:hypothetical protein
MTTGLMTVDYITHSVMTRYLQRTLLGLPAESKLYCRGKELLDRDLSYIAEALIDRLFSTMPSEVPRCVYNPKARPGQLRNEHNVTQFHYARTSV